MTSNADTSWSRSALKLAGRLGCELRLGDGPIVATAIHAGHAMRDPLEKWMSVDGAARRRDEDPLTNLWTSSADQALNVLCSRFEVDLNRSRDRALATDPGETWGISFWKQRPPRDEVERSLLAHDAFYNLMQQWMERLLERWGEVLVLDIHSYNHRRGGADAPEAPAEDNPDLDLGITTLDPRAWSDLVERFTEALRRPADGRSFDVRHNVSYPDGGYFPEWIYATYRDRVCTITIEVKKFYMDEWSGSADLAAVEAVRDAIARAIAEVGYRWPRR